MNSKVGIISLILSHSLQIYLRFYAECKTATQIILHVIFFMHPSTIFVSIISRVLVKNVIEEENELIKHECTYGIGQQLMLYQMYINFVLLIMFYICNIYR